MRRLFAQIAFFLLQNPFMGNFAAGSIHMGETKRFCSPGLNCYSCPAAAFSCPIGSLQNFLRGAQRSISLFVVGFLMATAAFFGRFICGFVCPMGLVQDLIYRVPTKKLIVRMRILSYLKYVVLMLFVILLPLTIRDHIEIGGAHFFLDGQAWFCAYICPSGTIFAAWPLALANDAVRGMLGVMFNIKTVIALGLLTAALFINRFFCRVLCPLGAIYALFNKVSFIQINFNKSNCDGCKKCNKACQLALNPITETTHSDCVRCGSCVRSCEEKALVYGTVLTKF